MDTRTRY